MKTHIFSAFFAYFSYNPGKYRDESNTMLASQDVSFY
jgi:hypothetical protein